MSQSHSSVISEQNSSMIIDYHGYSIHSGWPAIHRPIAVISLEKKFPSHQEFIRTVFPEVNRGKWYRLSPSGLIYQRARPWLRAASPPGTLYIGSHRANDTRQKYGHKLRVTLYFYNRIFTAIHKYVTIHIYIHIVVFMCQISVSSKYIII